jgi:hypothetical protein
VHRAVSRAALWAREAPASGEVDLDIETAPLGIEGAGLETIGGGISPRANCIRSVSRIEVSPVVPLSLEPAAVLAPIKAWPGSRERVSRSARRPPLAAARHDGLG